MQISNDMLFFQQTLGSHFEDREVLKHYCHVIVRANKYFLHSILA